MPPKLLHHGSFGTCIQPSFDGRAAQDRISSLPDALDGTGLQDALDGTGPQIGEKPVSRYAT